MVGKSRQGDKWLKKVVKQKKEESMPETEERIIIKVLRMNFEGKERLQMGDQMANAIRNINQSEEELSAVQAQYKSKIKQYQAEIANVAEKLNTGWEMRPIECLERRVFNTGNIEIYRKDTGEKIDERAMTAEERQRNLFEDKPEAPAEEAEQAEIEPGVEGAEAIPGPPLGEENLPEDTSPFYTGQKTPKS